MNPVSNIQILLLNKECLSNTNDDDERALSLSVAISERDNFSSGLVKSFG